jgi:hypothetical protein
MTAVLLVSSVALVAPVDAVGKRKITLVIKASTIKVGQTAHATGKVIPAAPGKSVQLQQQVSGAWKNYGKAKKLGKTSTFDFAIAPKTCGFIPIRVKFAKTLSPTVRLAVNPKSSSEICINGPEKTVKTTRSGQKAQLVFKGTRGQVLTLTLKNSNWQDGSYVSVFAPNGSPIYPGGYAPPGSGPNLFVMFDGEEQAVLPATGKYTIEIDPGGAGIGRGTVRLQSPSPPIKRGCAIAASGGEKQIATNQRGQKAQCTFKGERDQIVTLTLRNSNWQDGSYVSLIAPNGTPIYPAGYAPPGSGPNLFVMFDGEEQAVLPATGKYTIEIDPLAAGTGHGTVGMDTPEPSIRDDGALTVNGAAKTATTFDLGQMTHLKFNGTAGQTVTIRLSASTWEAGSYLSLIAPDGNRIYPWGYAPPGSGPNLVVMFDDADQPVLPATGTYTIEIDPLGHGIGHGSVQVTSP